jgi:hypothetical protein
MQGESLSTRAGYLLTKAASALTMAELWESEEGADVARSWLASIRSRSALDVIAQHALVMNPTQGAVSVFSDFTADEVSEGAPKPVRRTPPDFGNVDVRKVVAMVVITGDVVSWGGPAAVRFLDAELASAVTKAGNQAVVDLLLPGATAVSAGADALASLTAGLAALDPSDHVTVIATTALVRELALSDRTTMGIAGGPFIGGVDIVRHDGDTGSPSMLLIPSSRVAMVDHGLELRSAGHADVDLRDNPEAPAQLTSLWQTNSRALVGERRFRMVSGSPAVAVG